MKLQTPYRVQCLKSLPNIMMKFLQCMEKEWRVEMGALNRSGKMGKGAI